MARERMNTSQFPIAPEGHYIARVVGVPEKKTSGRATFRIWKFQSAEGQEFDTVVFPWTAEELVLATGGKKISDDVLDWDDEEVAGKWIECDLIHEKDEKTNKTRTKLVNIKPYSSSVGQENTPEPAGMAVSPEDVQWDD